MFVPCSENQASDIPEAQSVIPDKLDTLLCERWFRDLIYIAAWLSEALTRRKWKTQMQEQIDYRNKIDSTVGKSGILHVCFKLFH